MSDAIKKCPQCGDELPVDAPAGICPKCLLAAGLAMDTGVGGEFSNSDAPTSPPFLSSRFVPPTPKDLAKLFPQLEILELIGAGGMGAVYKARQPGLDRFVAVKILPPEVGVDPSFAQRFAREAQALARLGHQHIVSVYDFGSAGGLFYFIMEYVDGANLRHLIKTGGLQPAEALAIVPQICEALQFAHDEGIVHRDIKPENILLDKRGRVKIADFGLARLLGNSAPDVSLTGTNQVLGTLHYMAPEQIQGLRSVDHRADIYSLGVVFYEMLTGELPLGRFAPPSQKAEVDIRLDEVVLRSLESEPIRRYQHVSEVKSDVERISLDSAANKAVQAARLPLADRPTASSDSTVANTTAHQSIKKLATALLVLGGLGFVAIFALPLWLAFDGAERLFASKVESNTFHVHGGNVALITTIYLSACYAAIAFPHALLITAAGLFLRNRRGYWLAITACVLAALPIAFIFPIGLPIGLWGLAVLTSQDVRAAFPKVSPSNKSPEERLHWPAIALIVAGMVDLAIGLFCGACIVLYVAMMPVYRDPAMIGGLVNSGAAIFFAVPALALGVLRLAGGIRMLRLQSYGFVSFASVASLLPISLGSLLGVPAGIWALIVLSQSDVRKAFAKEKDRLQSLGDSDLKSDPAGPEVKAAFVANATAGGDVKSDVERLPLDGLKSQGDYGVDSPVAAQSDTAGDNAANPWVERAIQNLANVLLMLGGIGIVAIFILSFWLAVDGAVKLYGPHLLVNRFGEGPTILSTTIWLSLLYAIVAIPNAFLMFVAGLFLRNGHGYRLAVAACVVAALPLSLVFPLSIPIGLWGLAVLTTADVRAVFKAKAALADQRRKERGQNPAIAERAWKFGRPITEQRFSELAQIAKDRDESDRSAELAEIAPDWLAYVMMGLFGLGWLLIGLMWNFRHAGVAIAIFAMFLIFLWVVQWKLAYLPKLRLEIGRQPLWKKVSNGVIVALMFFAGMVCVIAGQVAVADWMTDTSSVAPTSLNGTHAKTAAELALRSAHFEGLSVESAKLWMRGGSFNAMTWSNLTMSWFPGVMFVFAAAGGLIHTRRYRYTWKHWWAPTLSVVFGLLVTLMFVHSIHAIFVGYQSGSRKVREIRCTASRDAAETAINRWAAEKAYQKLEFCDWQIQQDGAEVGQVHARHLLPRSWFDRYRASWSYLFLRPKPPLYITLVTSDSPAEAYLRVEYPFFSTNSPEEAMWATLLDGLEERIHAAAAEEAKTRSPADTPDEPNE